MLDIKHILLKYPKSAYYARGLPYTITYLGLTVYLKAKKDEFPLLTETASTLTGAHVKAATEILNSINSFGYDLNPYYIGKPVC